MSHSLAMILSCCCTGLHPLHVHTVEPPQCNEPEVNATAQADTEAFLEIPTDSPEGQSQCPSSGGDPLYPVRLTSGGPRQYSQSSASVDLLDSGDLDLLASPPKPRCAPEPHGSTTGILEPLVGDSVHASLSLDIAVNGFQEVSLAHVTYDLPAPGPILTPVPEPTQVVNYEQWHS